MMPGYETVPKFVCSGLYLNCDTATKFVSSRTILNDISDKLNEGWKKNEIEEFYTP
jgi:hypothetical protein